jgi:hypothetical protein
VKVGVLGKVFELLVQNFQTFLRHIIGSDVINRNLQPLEAGVVQPLNALRNQEISVGDQSGDHSVPADAANDVVKFRVQQRFSAADGNHSCAQLAQFVHPAEHFFSRHWLRKIVKLIAISAGKIAAADGNDVRQQRMLGRSQRLGNHLGSPDIPGERLQTAAQDGAG